MFLRLNPLHISQKQSFVNDLDLISDYLHIGFSDSSESRKHWLSYLKATSQGKSPTGILEQRICRKDSYALGWVITHLLLPFLPPIYKSTLWIFILEKNLLYFPCNLTLFMAVPQQTVRLCFHCLIRVIEDHRFFCVLVKIWLWTWWNRYTQVQRLHTKSSHGVTCCRQGLRQSLN